MNQGTLDFSKEPKNLTAEQQAVWDIIKQRPGRDNALSAGEIGSMAGFPEDIKSHYRLVRRIIRELVVDHYLNIGSSPSGFFMIANEDEMDDCYRSLRSMGLKILQKAARIKKVSLHKFLGQLSMEIEQEEEKKSEAGNPVNILGGATADVTSNQDQPTNI